MPTVTDFYRGQLDTPSGSTYEDILKASDGHWDAAHDFVQYAFPTPEPSMFNREAPLVAAEDVEAFKADPELRKRLVAMYRRFLEFLGLYFCDERLVVDEVPSEGAASRRRITLAQFNHNFLRFTRVFRSMSVLGQPFLAKAFHDYLVKAGYAKRFPESAEYWKAALAA